MPAYGVRSAYRIAEADVGDLDEICRLELECFGSRAYDRNLIRFLLLDPDSIALKAVDESGRIIGSAIGRIEKIRGSIVGRVYTVEVKPEHRGRGVGRSLLTRLEEEFRRMGCEKLVLEVAVDNEPAIKLYKSLGFRFIERLKNYYGRGKDSYRGEKTLEDRR